MNGYAEVGLIPQLDFSLNGRKAGFGMSAKIGMKESANFVFDFTKASDGSLYSAMRDSYCRTTIPWSVTAHASANLFKKYNSSKADTGLATASYTFQPESEPIWGADRYIFPLFSNVAAQRTNGTTAHASANVSRELLLPVQLGFSLLDKDNKIIKTQYDSRTYQADNLFINYGQDLEGMSVDGKYTVCPSVILFGRDVLASPSVEIEPAMHFPVTLSDFVVTNFQYKENGFTYRNGYYSYRFDVSVTATLDEDAEGIAEWGYVYLDPKGKEVHIPLTEFGHSYIDTRWAYFRNEYEYTSTTILYGYVKYEGSDEYLYGEPQE